MPTAKGYEGEFKIYNEQGLIELPLKEKKEPLNPENLISYYFKNREEYEKELENYDLMMGQTEGILTDKDFEEELTEEINDNAGEMVRRAE